MEDRDQGTGLRDQQKQFTRTTARIADVCDECCGPIWPGDPMVIYVERYLEGPTLKPQERYVTRHYCGGCGKLLEDSLTTTEEVR